MKYLVAGFVFFLTLGLSMKSIANEPNKSENKPADASCTAESTQCAPTAEVHHGEGEHEDLAAKMNSLFPPKKKNPALATKPEAVEPKAPKFLETVSAPSVKLEWSESKATDYHVQVATDPNFKWLVVNEKFVKGNSYDFQAAEPRKKYFWRVAAFNPANDSYFTKSNFNSSAFVTK